MSVLGRIQKGHNLFTKGNVELVFEDETMLQFKVKSNKKEYLVSINEHGFRCNECEDWTYRWKRCTEEGGSFLCAHCYAAMFKLAELRGVGQQATLQIPQVKEVG